MGFFMSRSVFAEGGYGVTFFLGGWAIFQLQVMARPDRGAKKADI